MNTPQPFLIDNPTFSPPKTLLIGAPGTGKTHSLRTYCEADIELGVIVTEPMGLEVLADISSSRCHWIYIPIMDPGWDILISNAKKINSMSYDDLAGLKTGISKNSYNQFITLLSHLSNFICQRCGKNLGPVDQWGPDKALAIDSLSGINVMAMDLVIGAKPTKHQGEWGVAMDNEERLINKLASSLECFFTLTAHPVIEKDELLGGTTIMADILGRKLGPRLPRFFSDVVKAYRTENKFLWSVTDPRMDLKARNLPTNGAAIPQDFGQIVSSWQQRNKLAK